MTDRVKVLLSEALVILNTQHLLSPADELRQVQAALQDTRQLLEKVRTASKNAIEHLSKQAAAKDEALARLSAENDELRLRLHAATVPPPPLAERAPGRADSECLPAGAAPALPRATVDAVRYRDSSASTSAAKSDSDDRDREWVMDNSAASEVDYYDESSDGNADETGPTRPRTRYYRWVRKPNGRAFPICPRCAQATKNCTCATL